MSTKNGRESENGIVHESAIARPSLIIDSAHPSNQDRTFQYYIEKENGTSGLWDQMLTHPKPYFGIQIKGYFFDINDEGYVIWTDEGGHFDMLEDARKKHLPEITNNTPLIHFAVSFLQGQVPLVWITSYRYRSNDRVTNKFAGYLGRNISQDTLVSVIEESARRGSTRQIDIRTSR